MQEPVFKFVLGITGKFFPIDCQVVAAGKLGMNRELLQHLDNRQGELFKIDETVIINDKSKIQITKVVENQPPPESLLTTGILFLRT